MSDTLDQFQNLPCATPTEMDELWAKGWRHFGTHFFRYSSSWHDGKRVRVLPLRIDLRSFLPSRSQRRVLKRNADVRVKFGQATIDAEREQMFARHRSRFKEYAPDSLRDFLSSVPSHVPCEAKECRLYVNNRLIGIGYFDIGEQAVSAIYSMFDPGESKRSPGIKLIIEEIHWATKHNFRYFYLGYSYDRPSFYDYKKRFEGSEYLDWQSMRYSTLKPGYGGIAN